MKNKQEKSEALIQAEKAETADLITRILEMTSRVPAKVMNELDYYGAKSFKELAVKARQAASSKSPQLAKLRSAYSSISGYYK